MTGEMIERVAKGMFECRPAYKSASGKVRWTWDTLGEEQSKAQWRKLAVAAIAAMREPTEAMVEAGRDSAQDENARNTWRDMIDEAIANP